MRLSELPLLTLALIFIIPGLILIAFCAWLFWLGINFILIQGHQYRSEPIVGGFVFVDVNDNGQEISEEEKRKLPEKSVGKKPLSAVRITLLGRPLLVDEQDDLTQFFEPRSKPKPRVIQGPEVLTNARGRFELDLR